jgi:hypothetical protein
LVVVSPAINRGSSTSLRKNSRLLGTPFSTVPGPHKPTHQTPQGKFNSRENDKCNTVSNNGATSAEPVTASLQQSTSSSSSTLADNVAQPAWQNPKFNQAGWAPRASGQARPLLRARCLALKGQRTPGWPLHYTSPSQ